LLLRSSEIKPLFIDLTPHQRSRDARSSSPHPRAPRYPPPNIHTKPTPNQPRLPTLDFNRQSHATTQPRESTAPLKPAARSSFTTLTAPRAHLGQSQFHSTPHHTYTSPNTPHLLPHIHPPPAQRQPTALHTPASNQGLPTRIFEFPLLHFMHFSTQHLSKFLPPLKIKLRGIKLIHKVGRILIFNVRFSVKYLF